jgi:hypothetical protein
MSYDTNSACFFRLYGYDDVKSGIELEASFDPVDSSKFEGQVYTFKNRDLTLAENVINYYIDMRKGTVAYADMPSLCESLKDISLFSFLKLKLMPGKEGLKEMRRGVLKNTMPLAELKNNETFTRTANLCVNLINYINAHNVTVVPRTEPIRRAEHTHPSQERKFNLITLKDRTTQEYEPRDEPLWQLKERIYVIGHDRRYRNPDGSIRMTSWIPPHIRGPPNAPFREQRYKVLAEKLQREIDMYRRCGIKHDSEMWIQRENP